MPEEIAKRYERRLPELLAAAAAPSTRAPRPPTTPADMHGEPTTPADMLHDYVSAPGPPTTPADIYGTYTHQ